MGEPKGGAERRDRSGLRVEGSRRCAVSRPSGPLAGAALLGALVAARGIPAAGQEPPPRPPVVGEACSHPDFHAFDYWLGRWTVRNPDGDAIGHSHVSRVSDGCAVLEEWTDALGGTGTSLTFLEDRDTGAWRQTWVGGYGWIQDFRGGVVDGVMTLAGDRTTTQGTQRHRIRWVPLEGGRVEQQMDVSRDGGATWQPGSRGLYVPLGDSAVADRLEACNTPEAHRFLFWEGEWDVRNRQRSILRACVKLKRYLYTAVRDQALKHLALEAVVRRSHAMVKRGGRVPGAGEGPIGADDEGEAHELEAGSG